MIFLQWRGLLSNYRLIGFTLSLMLLLSLASPLWAGDDHDQRALEDFDVTGVGLGGPFTLVGAYGKTARLKDVKGKVVVLTFGYTYCPDVCPTALLEMASARKSLGKKAEEVRGIFITIDPGRDTPARMTKYVAHFDPTFLGLSGSEDAVKKVARQYGAQYRLNKTSDDQTNYLVDHSAYLYVLDRKGKIRYIMAYNIGRKILAAALEKIVDE